MAMTETKRKYLLTIALLHKAPCLPFRPIDLAVRLGVSRASVSRMLLEFDKEGLLLQKDHSYQLSEAGLAAIAEALDHYRTYYTFCTTLLQLSAFDAHECCISLLCGAEEMTLKHLSQQMRALMNTEEKG